MRSHSSLFLLPAALSEQPCWLFTVDDDIAYPPDYVAALETDSLVNVLGIRTMACHSSLLAGLSLQYFKQPGMADLYLASWCQQQQIPLIAIARHAGWLEQLGDPEADSLWAEFCEADPAQAALVRAHRPWGYAAIKDAVDAASTRARADDPESPLPQRRRPSTQPTEPRQPPLAY